MSSAITLKDVWKKYTLNAPNKLTEAIPSFIFRKKGDEFWALKGISFTVNVGDRIGIIGPNGSGKSTLLKVLSGVTYPTRGSVDSNGKIATLLDLGTGFHQELTGRENIYLYSAVLGISGRNVRKVFNEIVEFSGIAQFIDMPVKHYSSGMYVRLAFSVATHLAFDILLIDEVLSVGDLDFQKKSLQRIKEIMNSEKTILIVSHNLEILAQICTKIIYMKNGQIEKIGTSKQVIRQYINENK